MADNEQEDDSHGCCHSVDGIDDAINAAKKEMFTEYEIQIEVLIHVL